MVLQKLPLYLKAIDSILLMKYDGERSSHIYTIKLIYHNVETGNLGKDTDSPSSVLAEIAGRENDFPLEEAMELFSVISEKYFSTAIILYGKGCVASVKIEEKEEQIYYSLYIQTDQGSTHVSNTSFSEALTSIFNESGQES